MAAKTWTDIATTRVDGESPVTEQLLTDYWSRQESLVTQLVDVRFSEVSHNTTSYTNKVSTTLFLHPGAGTAGGTNCTLVLVFEAKVSAGTGNIRARIGSGTYQSVAVTSTGYARHQITISAADVNTYKGQEIALTIDLQAPSGGTIYAQNLWSCCRLERA